MAAAAPALLIGSTLASAALSAKQASDQNKAISRSMRSSRDAAAVQQKQITEQAAIEQAKNRNRAAQVRGRLRVLAAGAGTGMGGSTLALLRQADYDEAINEQIIETNARHQNERLRSGLDANLLSLESRVQNVLLSTLSGGLGGFNTGLSINGAIESFGEPTNSTPPELSPVATTGASSTGLLELPDIAGSAFA